MPKVFFGPRASVRDRNRAIAAMVRRNRGEFSSPEAARGFLDLIYVPVSRRWAFLRNSKAGNTSAIRRLFEIEFGTPLSTHLSPVGDINSDGGAHRLGPADVFRPASAFPDPAKVLKEAVRITTVRHPTDRALSSFLYICQSDKEENSRFVNDRLRMNALVGFDWDAHSGRKEGFMRFLRYIELTVAEGGMEQVDGHWRPQIRNIRPNVFKPDIVGRLEAFDRFREELQDRLGGAGPGSAPIPVSNRGQKEMHEDLLDRETIALIEKIYRADFEWLGYDPAQPGSLGGA